MVSNSKILTVSYGTFSCTLEGFDDSFDTMKAIAEYFRDLAADDRYFGAEPAAPDAEMLARIAEREISRRVEAHDTNGKIHLRAGTAALSAADRSADKTAEFVAPTPPDAEEQTAAEPVEQTAPTLAPALRAAHSASESMADKLRRIRAVAAPSVSTFPGSGFDEDDNAEDFLTRADSQSQEIQRPEPQTAPETQATPEAQADPVESTDVAAEDAPSETTLDSGATAAVPDLETEFAKNITVDPVLDTAEPASEVVVETAQETETDDTEASDESDDDLPEPEADAEGDDDILTRLSADAHAAPDAAPDTAEEADVATAAEQPDDLDAFLRDASVDAEAMDDTDDYDDEADDAYGAGDDTLSQLLADTMDGGAKAADASVDDDPAVIERVETEQLESELAESTPDDGTLADEGLADDAPEAEAEPDDHEAAAPHAARVIKMKRSDLDAALASGNLQEEMEATAVPDDLSDEAEADLQRELAEVEAELHQSRAPETIIADVAMQNAPTDTEDEDEDEADIASLAQDAEPDEANDAEDIVEADHESDSRRAKNLGAPASDAQTARIFDEANSQLQEPESNQRRNAIQHLRAAVAATKAERSAGGAMQIDVDDQPYRNDLQSAVRPRRPQPVATSMTPRPSANPAPRPAPLKLVAEQRIDAPGATAVQPVRPRRITRADLAPAKPEQSAQLDGDNAAEGSGAQGIAGFADFAEQMGASSLTEMLEAAAAYMADVEGMSQFSRPMLMQKLREAQEEEFTREDGLRSFGQLLREGKLQKLKGGRFAVTSVTEFRQSA